MEQQITFTNSKGDKLAAIILLVDEDRTRPIIIMAHGFRSSKNGSNKKTAQTLHSKGINTFRFDFYGHGESGGNYEDVTVSEGVDDILQAIIYLKQKGFSKIGLFGNSFGGACSILAAGMSNDLYLLALISPVADYYTRELMTKTKVELSEWRKKGFREYVSQDGTNRKLQLKYNFFLDMQELHGFQSAARISVPTCIVHGDQDTMVPIILSEMLSKAIQNSELKVINGADHYYSDPELKTKALGYLIEFIVKNS